MSDARRLRAAALSFVAGAALALGCSAPATPAPCPSGTWCGHSGAALEALRQTQETVLTCPKYLAWSQDGGARPAAELSASGEASLDLLATRKRRLSEETDACCYHWYQVCPSSKAGADGGAR